MLNEFKVTPSFSKRRQLSFQLHVTFKHAVEIEQMDTEENVLLGRTQERRVRSKI